MKSTQGRHPVAIVTGAGRRLGRCIALALGKNGFDVVVGYNRSSAGAAQTLRQLAKMGVRSFSMRTDVSRKADVRRLVKKTLSEFGKIDLLVNNTAIFLHSPLDQTTERTWDTTIDINLKGTFLCSQAVASCMLKQKSGKIINIASLGGVQAWTQHLPYSVSKAGVIMLTKILAKSLAPHVQVNAIAPGTIIMKGEETIDMRHVPMKAIPLKRYGTPSDITDMVIYLATTATYITGQVFTIDGGRSIQ